MAVKGSTGSSTSRRSRRSTRRTFGAAPRGTVQRMAASRRCAYPGCSDLNFATRPNCEGLGLIGRNQTASKTLGLHLHRPWRLNGEGLPLGVDCGFDAPPDGGQPPETRMRRWRQTRSATAWNDGLRYRQAAAAEPQDAGDQRHGSGGRFFDCSTSSAAWTGREGLVRAKHDRCLAKGPRSCLRPCAPAPPTGTSRSKSTA